MSVPIGLFGQKEVRRHRRGASGSVRGAPGVWCTYRDLLKQRKFQHFLKCVKMLNPYNGHA